VKFAHIADTHIKNLKYHYEYKEVFKQLYEVLREENVDCIVHCGDIAHTKTQISPEFVELCTGFFRNLASIAPTYIILGNHDGNLRNSSRQDAITPIVDALACPDLHLLKNAGETALNADYTLNVLSVFDEDNWMAPTDKDKINIALYHGSISGVKTDAGWVMERGEHDIKIFDDFDFAFLGDIHKTNQTLDAEGRIRYPGSTIQQNHGETNDKGILVWDIQDRDTWDVKHVVFKNPKPFMTIELTPKGRMPKGIDVVKGARLRLVSNNNLPLNKMKKAIDVAKHRFKPESITFLNRAAGTRGSVDALTYNLVKEDLRDPVVQEELIEEYLKEYEIDDDLIEEIHSINTHYNRIVEKEEEITRNVNWKLTSFKFDNLFNFGEGNSIDFGKMSGIVGIFGKNYSGKTSIIDGLLFTLFNSTSKNERKNLNVINQHKEECSATAEFLIGENVYTVSRQCEKYVKKLKGEETLEAKTYLDFTSENLVTGDTTSENGLTRNDTDKNIRKIVGTLDDFLLSSMSSQHGALQFINEGTTRRKEIFAKFLDLEVFEKKFKLAKEDSADMKGALKRLEDKDYNAEIAEQESQEAQVLESLGVCKQTLEAVRENHDYYKQCVEDIERKIESVPADIVDIANVKKRLKDKRYKVTSLCAKNDELQTECNRKESTRIRVDSFISSFEIESYREKQIQIEQLLENQSILGTELRAEQSDFGRNQQKGKLLEGIPCGTEYPKCKFIRDAHVAVANLPANKELIHEIGEKVAALKVRVTDLEPERVQRHLSRYEDLLRKSAELSGEISDCRLRVQKNKTSIVRIEKEISELEVNERTYEENRHAIENLEALLKDKALARVKSESAKAKFEVLNAEFMGLHKEHGSIESKIESLRESERELADLQKRYAAYDLFMRCMHSNGIAYDIIKKKLPVINEEIAKVLANIVDFEIFFEDDGKKMNVFIKHPRHEARPLEMGSGAEKTLAAMAIRLSLLSVSSLPKGDIFILDEPGTALDEENMEGFIRILELIKTYFKTVLLISHLESLKDCVDTQITIDKNDGYAIVNQ
jgi:DNA repair exonuclease SbcCD ATPase subunit/DNA repair exonuclease SbcCD nuclease subunit